MKGAAPSEYVLFLCHHQRLRFNHALRRPWCPCFSGWDNAVSQGCVEEQQNVLKLRYLLFLMLKYPCPVVNLTCDVC